MLLAVPRGTIATGISRSGMFLMTFATVPSPPAAITKSAGNLSTSGNSALFVEQYLDRTPASFSAATRSSLV
jgi:hypothetical protein